VLVVVFLVLGRFLVCRLVRNRDRLDLVALVVLVLDLCAHRFLSRRLAKGGAGRSKRQ
jgi:hypothetical protein